MVNVRIIESSSKDEYDGFEEFKEDYVFTNLNKNELMVKHNIDENKFRLWRKHAISETGFNRKCYCPSKKSQDELDELYPLVAEAYMGGELVKHIRNNFNLSQSEWIALRNRVKRDYGYMRKSKREKFISRNKDGKYQVCKTLKGKSYSFGVFSERDIAIRIRDEMEKVGWNRDLYWEVRARVLGL